jgi:predicted restriction endonuclease
MSGYDKHYDTCRIKEVKSFPGTVKISEINHISNLIALCKNHHWELDHGLMSKPDLAKIKLVAGIASVAMSWSL